MNRVPRFTPPPRKVICKQTDLLRVTVQFSHPMHLHKHRTVTFSNQKIKLDTNSPFRGSSTIKIFRNAKGDLAASGEAAIEHFNASSKTKPAAQRQRVVLWRPFQLETLSEQFQQLFNMTDNVLMHGLRSERALPLIKECFTTVCYDPDLHPQLVIFLEETRIQFTDLAGDLAHLAQTPNIWPPPDLKIYHEEIIVRLAQFAYRIGQANYDFLSKFHRPDVYLEQNVYFDGGLVLLFALRDFMENEIDGFFAVLLESELAGMVKSTVRRDWERLYSFKEEEEEQQEDSMDPNEQGNEPNMRSTQDRDEMFEHEGKEGKEEDWYASLVVGPARMVRNDSGMGGE